MLNRIYNTKEEYIDFTQHQLNSCLKLHTDYLCPNLRITASTQVLSCAAAVIGTMYPNILLSSASLHGHPRSSLGATLGVRMSVTAYGNLSTVSCVWPIGTSRLNLRPRPLSI